MDLKKLVGTRVRQARLDAGLTQTEAAEVVGISQNVWSGYESGRVNIPLDTLARIVEILNRPIEYFVVENYEYMTKAPLPKAESPGARAKKRKAA